jgi:DNA end-binding protein Ku
VGQQAFAVIREAIKEKGMVAIARVVFTSREHVIALEPRGKGMMGITIRYPYEVRDEKDYFEEIPNEKITKDMLELAAHIVKTKQGHFQPDKFEDRYEEAVKDLIKRKSHGEKIEKPESEKPSNVVDLMEALRASVEGKAGKKTERRKPAREHHRAAKKAGRSSARHRKAS